MSAYTGTALHASNGGWSGDPTDFTYQWQRSPDGSTGWTNIAAATTADYTPGQADEGQYLRCVVTATNLAGADSADSNVVGPVLVAPITVGAVAHEWVIEARNNATLERIGIIEDYQQATIVPRFNAVGAWTLDLHIGSREASFFDFDAGIVVSLDGTEFFSGPLTERERSRDEEGADRLRLSGVDDSVWLARRLCYPEAPALTTATDGYDVRTGVASTVMAAYVDANAGPSADADRVVAGLMLAADPLIGSSVTGRGRFQTLQEILNELALAGGDLGYRIVQTGDALVFTVYQPVNRSASVRFDDELGNLRAFTYSERAPSGGNFIVVGGGGEDIARVFVTGGDAASITRFGRIEAFQDRRDTTDTTELEQARDTTLSEGAAVSAVGVTPQDTRGVAYGSDYGLGDKVAVVIDGVTLTEVVREVGISITPDGAMVLPVVGTPNETDPRATALFQARRQIDALKAQLRDVQRRQ